MSERFYCGKHAIEFAPDKGCPECQRQSSLAAMPGYDAASWLVRMVEGMRRDTYGIFIDGSTRPIIKSKNEAELQRVADAHNKTLPQNDELKNGGQ